MRFSKVISILAVFATAAQAGPIPSSSSSLDIRAPESIQSSSSPVTLITRQSDIIGDLGTIFAGLDNLTGTVSVAIDTLLGTFFAGGAAPQVTANAIATILGKSQAVADAIATILTALKSCN